MCKIDLNFHLFILLFAYFLFFSSFLKPLYVCFSTYGKPTQIPQILWAHEASESHCQQCWPCQVDDTTVIWHHTPTSLSTEPHPRMWRGNVCQILESLKLFCPLTQKDFESCNFYWSLAKMKMMNLGKNVDLWNSNDSNNENFR